MATAVGGRRIEIPAILVICPNLYGLAPTAITRTTRESTGRPANWAVKGPSVDRGGLFPEAHWRRVLEGSPTFIMNDGRQKLFGNVGYRLLEANVQELLRKPSEDEANWC